MEQKVENFRQVPRTCGGEKLTFFEDTIWRFRRAEVF